MAGPYPWRLYAHHNGRIEIRDERKAGYALFGYALVECTHAYFMVSAERGCLLCHEKSTHAKAK